MSKYTIGVTGVVFVFYLALLMQLTCPATRDESRNKILKVMGLRAMSCTFKAHDLCDWVQSERRLITKEEKGQCLAYWLHRFCGVPRPLPVIKKFTLPADQSF